MEDKPNIFTKPVFFENKLAIFQIREMDERRFRISIGRRFIADIVQEDFWEQISGQELSKGVLHSIVFEIELNWEN